MKYMRSVFMYINTINIFSINIPSNMWSFIYYKAFLSFRFKPICHNRSKQSGTNNKIIV